MKKFLNENNHHFSIDALCGINDFKSGIISTTNRIIRNYEETDPNFKKYKYCIINRGGDADIKIPDFLKDKTETVEKVKKFLWFTTKRWTENIEKKYILEIQSPFLMNYETNFPWLSNIDEVVVVIPLNPTYGVDYLRYQDGSIGSGFTAYDFTNAYGWVVRHSSTLAEDNTLNTHVLMVNFTDYMYDSTQKGKNKIVHQNWKTRVTKINDNSLDEVLSHELMHLYDAYKILLSRKKYANKSKNDKYGALGKSGIYRLELNPSFGDEEFIKKFNRIAYIYDDTERNAFNNGFYTTISKYLEDTFRKRKLSSFNANYIAAQIHDGPEFKYVEEFCKTPNEEILSLIGSKNVYKLFSFNRYNFRKGWNTDAKLNYIKNFYKIKAEKLYKQRKNMLAEAIEKHNEGLNENYGYPSMTWNTSNNVGSSLNIMGYQYQLLPITSTLQQKPNKDSGRLQYLHIGSKVKAYTLGAEPKMVRGHIAKIEKNEAGEIINVYVLTYDPKKDGNILTKVNINKIIPDNHYKVKRMVGEYGK